MNAFDSVRSGYSFLSKDERKALLFITALVSFNAFLELASLSGIAPLMALIVRPSLINSSPILLWIYKNFADQNPTTLVLIIGGLLILSMMFSFGLKFYSETKTSEFVSKCQVRFSGDLAYRIFSSPYLWLISQNSTDLSKSVYSDASFWAKGFIRSIINACSSFALLIACIVTVMIFSPVAGFIAFLLMGLLGFIIYKIQRPLVAKSAAERKILANEVAKILTQAIVGIKGVKISSKERYFSFLYKKNCETLSKLESRVIVLQKVPPELIMLIGQLTLILILVSFVALDYSVARIVSEMAIFILVASRVLPGFNRLSASLTTIWEAAPINQVLTKIISATSDPVTTKNIESIQTVLPKHVELIGKELNFSYGISQKPALRNISFSIKGVGVYGLVGPSGSGKSTFIDLIIGLVNPTSGNLYINGLTIEEFGVQAWRQGIGYVPQSPYFLDDSLRKNIAFGIDPKYIDDKKVLRSLELANLSSLLGELKDGLDEKLGENANRLSGGQRQRVAIARALYSSPTILILDEATSGLDLISERQVAKALESISENVIVIVVTHKKTLLDFCDQLILLNEGELIEQGSMGAISKNRLFNSLFVGE